MDKFKIPKKIVYTPIYIIIVNCKKEKKKYSQNRFSSQKKMKKLKNLIYYRGR